MKARILGTSPGLPTLNKSCSSLWLNSAEQNILLDCGEGTANSVLKYNLGRDLIDAIIISHNHPDHITGIYMLLQLLYLQGRIKELIIFIPENRDLFLKSLEMFYLFEKRFRYNIIVRQIPEQSKPLEITVTVNKTPEIKPPSKWEKMYLIENELQPIEVKELRTGKSKLEIIPILNDHLSGYKDLVSKNDNHLLSYSFLCKTISGSGKEKTSLLYTSDIQSVNHLETYLNNVDFIIIDALHPKPEDVIAIANCAKKKVFLTHGISPKLSKMMEKDLPDKFVFAEDGEEVV